MSGHPDFEKFQHFWSVFHIEWRLILRRLLVQRISSSLATTSRTFVAVICDADEACSVNTAKEPQSSFTTSPQSTTRSLNFCSNSKFLGRLTSISVAE